MHTNITNKKSYIDIASKTCEERWQARRLLVSNGSLENNLDYAIAAYDDGCWKHEVLLNDVPTLREAYDRMRRFIVERKTFEPELGYNTVSDVAAEFKRMCAEEETERAKSKLDRLTHVKARNGSDVVECLKRPDNGLNRREEHMRMIQEKRQRIRNRSNLNKT